MKHAMDRSMVGKTPQKINDSQL